MGREDYGLGGIPSPYDPRDYPIEMAYSEEGGSPVAALPQVFAWPHQPPNLDQGRTPQCVAFSTAQLKAYQDRKDQGKFFTFNTSRFFRNINGGPNGAYIRSALKELLDVGYPEKIWGNANKHKIKSFYAINTSNIVSMKNTIVSFGPILVGTQWFRTWYKPDGNGVLPPPVGLEGGHAVYFYGWNADGWYCRNSWGRDWGVGGNCVIPFAYTSKLYEAWKTFDQIVK